MSILKRLNLKAILINLGILILIVVIIFFLLNKFLFWYTNHGESLTVPDFRGKNLNEMQALVQEKGLRFEIKDTVYDRRYPKLTVIDHNPKAGSKVKENRKIYMIINGSKAPKVTIKEDIIDQPFRQAVRILENDDIKVERFDYKSNIALNAVLELKTLDGRRLNLPADIEKGSSVVLVLGDGLKNKKIPVPDLKGKTLDEATLILRGNYLNLGRVSREPGVPDSVTAIISRQYPLPTDEETVSKGDAVDVWLKAR